MSISYIIIDKPTDNDVIVIVQKSFFSKGRGRGTINYEKKPELNYIYMDMSTYIGCRCCWN